MARPVQSRRDYPRMARVNTLLREIIGEELERIDDDRFDLITVTSVSCESDLRRALVTYDNLQGAEADEVIQEVLAEHRPRLQSAVARQARLKRTPELRFEPDLVLRNAERIEDVLRGLDPPTTTDE
ncbi:MAG: rbfA [Acidimicrobiales bacterium]|nr:rbfA [Acidimicrobiales bacterium]